MARVDPLRNFRFRLEIDNVTQAGFSEVAIADTTLEALDSREGSDPPHIRKLGGLTKYGNITLRRGLTDGGTALDLFKWHADTSARQREKKRKKIVIVVQHEAGTDGARFNVTGAWPVKFQAPNLNAKSNEVMIEILELANEGIERVP
jgi:phage tail-like protein